MDVFKGRHFQRDIILYAGTANMARELQEILGERGVNVDHTTIYRWCAALRARNREATAVVLA